MTQRHANCQLIWPAGDFSPISPSAFFAPRAAMHKMRPLAILLLLVASLLHPCRLIAQRATSGGASLAPGGPDLKVTLEKGLKARRPQEFAFVALVVARVHDRSLPLGLVESTFLWARTKQPYPMVYFERGLRERARRLGIRF